MLSTQARARLTVVLVGARNPSNIGAAARAMQDFGFSDLRIVNTFAAPFEAAQLEAAQLQAALQEPNLEAPFEAPLQSKSAVAAHHVMASARRFDTLAAAIADCTLILGTTAIGERQLTQPILPLQQTTPLLLAALNTTTNPGAPRPASGTWEDGTRESSPPESSAPEHAPTDTRVALLFGSEKTGLTNDQLSHCSLLTTIPMFAPEDARHLSMNLGQSVAVCLYELTRSGFESSVEIPPTHEPPSTSADRERLTQLLLDVFHATGYTRRYPANASEPLVRQLTLQLGASHREAMTWMGILRQVLWNATRPDQTPPTPQTGL
ncbi:MAG: TrmH family RNA methyltransferase [Acidobacteriaceae bacterium]